MLSKDHILYVLQYIYNVIKFIYNVLHFNCFCFSTFLICNRVQYNGSRIAWFPQCHLHLEYCHINHRNNFADQHYTRVPIVVVF